MTYWSSNTDQNINNPIVKSLKKNILLNAINTATSIIFPVITFPYAARVLLPEGIGAVNFLNSIISYIVLFTSLGIPMYAVKEVAKYQDNKQQRDKVTIEILLLSTILSLLGYIVVYLLAHFVPQIHSQSALFYVLSLTIIFTTIGANWFYQGIENFKFITVRAIVVRTLAAAALFIFVHSPSDLISYGFIIVGSTVGNNIINFVHLRKHISYNSISLKELEISKHLKPAIEIFVLNLIISLYVQLNSVMLGFMSGDEAVGFFTAGNKISHIALTMIASLGTVMLPRCAHLIKKNDMEGFSLAIHKSLDLILALSYPITLGLIILASPMTEIFCGKEYVPSIPVLYITAPVVIFVSLTNIMGIQILYPMDKVKLVIYSVSSGAIANLILNFILIPQYAAIGAAIATVFAEFMVLLLQIILGKRYYPFKIKDLFNIKIISSSIIMGLSVFFVIKLVHTNLSQLILGLGVGIIIYGILLWKMKLPILMESMNIAKTKLHIK